MKIVCISDTHAKWKNLIIPECDLLISTGDFSFRGEIHLVNEFHKWLNKQPAKHIISVMGNHETWVEQNFQLAKEMAIAECPRVHFIAEGLIEIEGFKIWCSAITPYFFNWAWNRFRGEEIKRHWDIIPDDIDILATHGPAYDILDKDPQGNPVGCEELSKRIENLTNLKVHTFGHLHESYGSIEKNGVLYINASICNDQYKPVNKPIVFRIDK